jgi:hypothetical protein
VHVVAFLLSKDEKRRVAIFRRDDGYFGLREEYWYENIYDGKLVSSGWAASAAEKSIFLTKDEAHSEALATFARLDLKPVLDDTPRQP